MNTSDFDHLRSAVGYELRAAMKAGDRTAVDALRSALHTLDNATAVAAPAGAAAEVPGRRVERVDIEHALHATAREHESAADEHRRLGMPARADVLQRQAALIRGCLSHLPDGTSGASP